MFAAVLNRRGGPSSVTAEDLLNVIERTHPGDISGTSSCGPFLACQTLLRVTPESRREVVPLVDAATGCVMVSWLRLDNRGALAVQLGWGAQRGQEATDPELVLAAYDRWGTGCAARLEGDFAFVLWDPTRRSVYAARDASGIKPLYYAQTDGLLACAASAVPLLTLAADGVDTSVSDEWVSRAIHHVSTDWATTAFRGVRKVPPGHWLQGDADDVRTVRYHQFIDDAPWESRRRDDWLHAYRERLLEAVRVRIRADAPIGVESSGGLDSSTVVALIATLAPDQRASMHTFGYVSEPLEPEYMLEVSRVLQIRNNHVLSFDIETWHEQRQRAWELLGHPAEHANAFGHVPFYELAGTFGVRTLHSGHGGDEVVTNSGSLAVREMMLRGEYGALWRDRAGPAWRRALSVARARWRRDRPRTSQLAVVLDRLVHSPLRAEVLESTGVTARTAEGAAYDSTYDSVNDFILGNRLSPSVSTRTAECSIVAAGYGVDYRWPLLDRRLMQQYLSTPAIWKTGEGMGRYLHRRAIDGMVPDKVTWKASKSMVGASRDHELAPGPVPSLDSLHPQVAELIDPQRWRRAAETDDFMIAATLRRSAEISDWLFERQ